MLTPNRPMHVVYVVAAGGGAETYVREIARGLVEDGLRVSIVYVCPPMYHPPLSSSDGPIHHEYARVSNLHWYVSRIYRSLSAPLAEYLFPPSVLKSAEATLAIRRAVRRIQLHINPVDLIELPEEIIFPAVLRGLPPYVVKLHSSDTAWRHFCGEEVRPIDRYRNKLESSLLRGALLVSAPSVAIADYVAASCNCPRSRILIVPYPLDTVRFSPTYADNQLLHGGANLSVLFVGRLVRRKGLFTLARSAASILDCRAEITIEIVGGETDEVTKQLFLEHIPGRYWARIFFRGRIPNDRLGQCYRNAAVCVVPSCWDNSPNTVYEAMGCGVPVVASAAGGIVELVQEGKTGLLVPPGDSRALGSAVRMLLMDDTMRERMGKAARREALLRFQTSLISRLTADAYRRALQGVSQLKEA